VIYGVKGADYYLHNPWFWAKMAAFAGVGLLSVPPTIAFIRWRKSATADAAFAPTDAQVAGVRRFLVYQVGLLMVLVGCAAAMARLG
jgi:putative membrane protein